MTNIKLVEAFSPRFQPTIRSDRKTPQAHVKELVLSNPNIRLRYKTIEAKIKDLQRRYDKFGYYLERKRINGVIYWKFGRSEDKEKGTLRNVPLYYSPTYQALFIPSSYIKKKRRLVSSVLMYRLKWLGIPYKLERVR